MKKCIAVVLLALLSMGAFGEVYPLAEDTDFTLTLTGLNVRGVQALPDGGYVVDSVAVLSNELTDNSDKSLATVVVRDLRVTVTISAAEVAQTLGVDTDASGWEATYSTKTIAEVNAAVIATVQAKILAIL